MKERDPRSFQLTTDELSRILQGQGELWIRDRLLETVASPALSISRQRWLNLLYLAVEAPEAIVSMVGISKEDINIFIKFIQAWTINFGLFVARDFDKGISGASLASLLLENRYKYMTRETLYRDCLRWQNEGKTIGLVHGAFDPPHIRHAQLTACVWPHCDHLIVGFEKTDYSDNEKASQEILGQDTRYQ